MQRVLVVDDMNTNRMILKTILQSEYQVDEAENGQVAIDMLSAADAQYSLVVLDLFMPVVDGFGVLDYITGMSSTDIPPVIVISSDNEVETEARCFDYGVSDFILKPFRKDVIKQRVRNVIALYEYQHSLEHELSRKNKELSQQNEELIANRELVEKSYSTIINVLGDVIESRNLESGTHVKNVRTYTKILGMQVMKEFPEYNLTADRVEMIAKASVLHDIGKISISDTVLLKPGRLTKEEFEIMKTHTTKGCEILTKLVDVWSADYQKVSYEIARYHHERFDGKGYPDALAGDAIPISAQLVSLADVYDALVSTRVYKAAYPREEAFRMIMNGECGQFNPKLLRAFISARELFEAYQDASRNKIMR